jgi:hypothetical protein
VGFRGQAFTIAAVGEAGEPSAGRQMIVDARHGRRGAQQVAVMV